MQSPRRPDPALVLLIVMLATLPALAWLQYSWIGEVEKADADRMRATLQRSADQLSGAVDSELMRFYRNVMAPGRPGNAVLGGAASGGVAAGIVAPGGTGAGIPNSGILAGPVDPCQALARWQSNTTQTRLIHGLYIHVRDDDNHLFQCEAETGRRHVVAWPAELKPLATMWQHGSGKGSPGPRLELLQPILMAPVRPPGPPGDWLRPGGPSTRQLFFHRGPESEEHSASKERLVNEQRRDEGPGPRGLFSIAIAVPDLAWMTAQWLPELVRQYYGDAESSDAVVRIETTASHVPIYSSGDWGAGAADSTVQLLRMPGGFGGPDTQGPPQGYWTLLARRKEGSVAAVAARVRNRNVAVSGGVLALMGLALAVLLVTLRRQKRLTQQQMEFVAGVSHELRTPVAVLSSAGENLADGIVTTPASVREYGAMIRDESRRLAGMIEQTLRFAGIQSGGARYKRQPVDVPQSIDAALRNHDALIRESGCAVELNLTAGLPPVDADPAALVHCIGNLLSNAARYAASGKSITVRARLDAGAAADKTPRLFIEVEDLGPGIDARDVPHLFEPFYRGRHSRERQVQGTGLGLALVKSIMDDLGGSVEVRTAKGQGSQFRLVLPATGPA